MAVFTDFLIFFVCKFSNEPFAALRHPTRSAVHNHLSKWSQVPSIFIRLSIIFSFKKMIIH